MKSTLRELPRSSRIQILFFNDFGITVSIHVCCCTSDILRYWKDGKPWQHLLKDIKNIEDYEKEKTT